MRSKKELAIILSKLKDFDFPDTKLEQYSTPSEIAADILWVAYMNGDIHSKTVLDAACGPGIFGLGALLLGAKKVYFVDLDKKILKTAKENLKEIKKSYYVGNSIFKQQDISNFKTKVDTVIQNPPFGVQNEHADKVFLKKAMEVCDKIYSIHKIESEGFIKALSRENNFLLKKIIPLIFSIKQTQKYHKRPIYRFKAACFILSNSNKL